MNGRQLVYLGGMGIITIMWYLFVLFLGICACVVLIKLAFGTLHIHITIDNPELFINQQNEGQRKKTDARGLVNIFEETQSRREPKEVAETPQEKELRRFKEMLKSDGLLSSAEIDSITFEDLQRYKKNV